MVMINQYNEQNEDNLLKKKLRSTFIRVKIDSKEPHIVSWKLIAIVGYYSTGDPTQV